LFRQISLECCETLRYCGVGGRNCSQREGVSVAGWTKLFSTIVTSSIWCEDHKTVRVWTGFLALADKDGVVEGSIPGLANVMRVTDDEFREILAKFLAPDPDSRSKDHDGRRIEEIPGGWKIPNHGPYRRKAEAGEGSRAPYYREYRARKRAEAMKYAEGHHGVLPPSEQPEYDEEPI